MNQEAEKFEKYGDEWWDPKGRLFSLHMINPLRFDYFSSKAQELKGKAVLDIGCGGGLLSERFAEKGAVVTGIDLSPSAIEAAKKHARKTGLVIDYRVASVAELLPEKRETFDVLVCSEVLEHVEDLRGFLGGALKLLKNGGVFFFTTINKTLKARLLAIGVAEYLLGLIPRGAHDFNKFIRPSALSEILTENGVEMLDIKGMSYDPFKMGFKISGDVTVNYLGYGVKRGGGG